MIIIPANSASGGYEVANSCRFDTNAGMTKASVAGTRTKATFSAWVKRSILGDESLLFYSRIDASNHFLIRFTGDDALELVNRVSASNITFYTTNAVYRDPSAWMHVLWSIDTTQASSGNRIKLFVNGTQVTSWATSTTQNQSTNLSANTTSDDYYVAQEYTSGDNYFDGYLAEVVWLDGTAGSASDFGEFNEDSPTIWKPKDVSGLTFGNSGFYLDFEDSSNLGNDANGGTDFTETNLAATDQATDTPTNNGNTLNPLATTTTQGTVSEGNLEFDRSGSSDSFVSILSTIGASSGKYYAEVKIIDVGSPTQGCVLGFLNLDETNIMSSSSTYLGAATADAGMGWYSVGNVFRQAGHVNIINSYTDNDIVMLAMDLDNGYCYFGKNGSWENSGDPTSTSSGTGGYATSNMTANGTYCFAFSLREAGNIQANFGSPPFSISSGNADANGYGNFEYAPPSGYYALCTKNLSEFG
jgi:hypothetical protein